MKPPLPFLPLCLLLLLPTTGLGNECPALKELLANTKPSFAQRLARLKAEPPLDPAKGEINYKILGEGNPETIVLIHGLDSATFTFDTITERLARKHRVLVYDQRGHGRSVARGENYSTALLADDLRALLDHLKIDRAHILGHSMGARTAVRFAELFPARAKSVIVEDMEMFLRADPAPEQLEKVLDLSAGLREKFKDPIFPSRQALKDALTPYYGKEAESLTYRRTAEQEDGTMKLLFHPDVSYLYGYQGNAEDLGPALAKLKQPVLFIRSEPRLGTALSDKGAEHIRKVAPSAHLEMIAGADHVVHRTRTEPFLELTETFLSRGAIPKASQGKYAPKLRKKGSIDLDAILRIEDDRERVGELSKTYAKELTIAQLKTLIARSPSLRNSYEIGAMIELARQSGRKEWLPVLDGWISQWENSTIGWQGVMRRTALRAREQIAQAQKTAPSP